MIPTGINVILCQKLITMSNIIYFAWRTAAFWFDWEKYNFLHDEDNQNRGSVET